MRYLAGLLVILPGIVVGAEATFAGGCFWCVEAAFDKVPGVTQTLSGYTGGTTPDPSYEEVSAGGTGHTEAVRVVYDETQVSYDRLLEVFWHSIDPTTPNQQFCDVGSQYRSAIFYHDQAQKLAADTSLLELLESGKVRRVVTEILPVETFYEAESYHQDYHEKNPLRYRTYRWLCGRDERLRELWGEEAFLD